MICMLSLGGIPPTVGFFGKFYIFKAAMETADTEMLWLVIIGVLNSAISIFYYLRVVMAMYFKTPEGDFGKARSGALAFVVVICVLVILQMGLMPGRWLGYAGG
jgi:NADH-quinone oxidoreductase subunit N